MIYKDGELLCTTHRGAGPLACSYTAGSVALYEGLRRLLKIIPANNPNALQGLHFHGPTVASHVTGNRPTDRKRPNTTAPVEPDPSNATSQSPHTTTIYIWTLRCSKK
ncbi:uncharacterized protein TM35_000022320 [Trypanosoma theileri]|uniref:Uncharacterized protein n=1 Tax=Trypanosoma theileri TaxID=67003 RepID=A0A1X0P7I1_9TRYP|nr:uncharacterized protein TM35_000022320 [Trypanosoma theileri]ORC92906.1 hypothetical protein TM35_000022320 [Trypanosoma theileri]